MTLVKLLRRRERRLMFREGVYPPGFTSRLSCQPCRAAYISFGDHGCHVRCRQCDEISPHLYKAERREWRNKHTCDLATAQRQQRRDPQPGDPDYREWSRRRVETELRARLWQVNPELAREVERGDARGLPNADHPDFDENWRP